jgi:hypothetical protein
VLECVSVAMTIVDLVQTRIQDSIQGSRVAIRPRHDNDFVFRNIVSFSTLRLGVWLEIGERRGVDLGLCGLLCVIPTNQTRATRTVSQK